MTQFGLSEYGFKPKDFNTIKDELEGELKKEVDPSLHFGPGSVAGVLTAIVAHQTRQVWEAVSGLYHSLQPDSAQGAALDSLCKLTGTYRRKATFSKAKAKVSLAAKTSLPAGSRIMTISGDFFKTTKEVSNGLGKEEEYEVDLIAEEVGPRIAHQETAAKIMTPTAGWSKIRITSSEYIGHNDESDEQLRARRVRELRAAGAATLDSMRSRLLEIEGVESVFIREDVDSFEVIIKGGEEQKIANTIWELKPLGTKTAGALTCIIIDSIKQSREIRFSRPTLVPLTLHVNIKVKRLIDAEALKLALANFACTHFKLGSEIYPSRFFASVLAFDNVLDVMSLQLRERASGSIAPSEIKEDHLASITFKDIYIEQIVEAS